MKALLRKIRQILRDRKTRRIFTRLVSTVAAIVVFVTTYALVLPAITMESEAACGIEAHQHDQSCYTDVLVCELSESPGHVHDESCYITKQKQACQIEEHVHDSDCYDGNGKLICEKDEHQHGEDCFEEVRELVCEIPESPRHQHDDSCYQKVLTCGREVHTHSTACYRADTASQAATEAIAVASTESAAAAATGNGLVDNLNNPVENGEPETSLDSSIENNVIEGNLDASPDYSEPGSDSTSLTNEGDKDEPGAWTSTEAAADATAGIAASTGSVAGAAGSAAATTGSTTGETAATAASAGATDTMSAATGYVPVLDELNFNTLLNKHTGIYYSRLAGTDTAVDNEIDGTDTAANTGGTQEEAAVANTGETQAKESDLGTNSGEKQEEAIAENTGEPQEEVTWNRIDKHTELKESDNVRLYLAYTIPAGSLNETNQTARYSLPKNIHLTDEQVNEINATVNGIARQYVSYDTLEILDQEMYGKYLGIEAVEGTRTPADDLDEYLANNEGQEFISATVKVENVFDENTGLLKAQDLVFAFAPYTIQKNQHQYDSEGKPTKAGEEVNGWLAIDISTEQIDWEKADDETKTADIIFVEKDKKSDLKEISAELRLVGAEVDSDTDTNVGNAAKGVGSDVAATDNKQDGTKDSETAAGESDKAEKEPVSYPSVSFDDSITVAGGLLSTDTDEAFGDAGMAAETEITVHVEADKDTFPEGTTMVLSTVSDDQMTAVAEAVEGAVDAPKTMGFHAVDISFRDVKGNEIEPLKPIRVSMTSDAIRRAVQDESTTPVVVHVSDPSGEQDAADENMDDGGSTDTADADEAEGADSQYIVDSSESTEEQVPGSNLETTPSVNIIETDTGTKENNGDTLIFEAEAFSVYAIVYTLDFHYEINGKMYEFSIPGGGFVSLEHIVEVLGIASADENTENGAENTENSAENGNDFVGEVSGVDESGENGAAYEEAIKLNEAEVSEATKKFVADVESVEFSNPELVWVGKVDEATTVGGLKEANGLEVEYSADLTEEQIAEINAQTVEAGDWALISLQPFRTSETLIITMSDGQVFTIAVTDDMLDPSTIERNAEYVTYIYTRVGNNDYYVLKNDGTTVPFSGNPSDLETLGNEYKWTITYSYTENAYSGRFDSGYRYYHIRPYSDPSMSLNVKEENLSSLSITRGNSETFIIDHTYINWAGNGGIISNANVEGAYAIGSNFSQRYNFGYGDFSWMRPSEVRITDDGVLYSDRATNLNEATSHFAPIWFYSPAATAYEFTVKTDNASMGTVEGWGKPLNDNETNAYYYEDAEEFTTRTTYNSGSTKSNEYEIKAVANNDDPNNPKYLFSHWELDGDSEPLNGVGDTIAAHTLSISKEGSELVAVFHPNLRYLPTDEELLGRNAISEEEFYEWLEGVKQGQDPLVNDACKKTAEVVDYENRIYRVDLTAASKLSTFDGIVDMAFIADVSASMKFPSKLKPSKAVYGTTSDGDYITIPKGQEDAYKKDFTTINDNWYNWGLEQNSRKKYYVIGDEENTSTVCVLWWNGSVWKMRDASKAPGNDEFNAADGTHATYYANADQKKLIIYESADNITGNETGSLATVLNKLRNDTNYGVSLNVGDPIPRAAYLEASIRDSITEMYSIKQQLTLASEGELANDYWPKVAYNLFCQYMKNPHTGTDASTNSHYFTLPPNDGDLGITYSYDGGTSTDIAILDAAGYRRSDTGTGDNQYKKDGDPRSQDWYKNENQTTGYNYNKDTSKIIGFQWDPTSTARYAILITDGAPQRSSVNIGQHFITEAKDLFTQSSKDTNGKSATLVSVGLSLDNVDYGKRMLYNISDRDGLGDPYYYRAESGDGLIQVIYETLQKTVANMIVTGKVTDTIGQSFYPVDENGNALQDSDRITLYGEKIPRAQWSNYKEYEYGVIHVTREEKNGKTENVYTVEWNKQNIKPVDPKTGYGWHGAVLVKAKEDLLGGNFIDTNDGEASIEAQGFHNKEDANIISLKNDYKEKIDLETPRVNVNELPITYNSTDWTVYLGEEVDPKDELTRLYEKIIVQQVITGGTDTNGDDFFDRVGNGKMLYPLPNDVKNADNDQRESEITTTDPVTSFPFKDLIKELRAHSDVADWKEYIAEDGSITDEGWEYLIAESVKPFTPENPGDPQNIGIVIPYQVYGNDDESVLRITMIKEVVDGEIDKDADDSTYLDEHITKVVGEGVEKYTLRILYLPDKTVLPDDLDGNTIEDYHVGNFGSMREGRTTGDETRDNVHTINVFSKPLDILKVDKDNAAITEKSATFELLRLWTAGDTDESKKVIFGTTPGYSGYKLDGADLTGTYYLVDTQDTDTNTGIARFGTGTDTAKLLSSAKDPYIIIEKAAPSGYAKDVNAKTITIVTDGTNMNLYSDLNKAAINNANYPSTRNPYNWNQAVQFQVKEYNATSNQNQTSVIDYVNKNSGAKITLNQPVYTAGKPWKATGSARNPIYVFSNIENTKELIRDDESGVGIFRIQFLNEPGAIDITIHKVDDKNNALAGATFKLMNGSQIVSVASAGDGVVIEPKVIGETVTIKNNTFTIPAGGVTIKNLQTSDTEYEIVEVDSPDGYVITNDTPVKFKVTSGELTDKTMTTGVEYASEGNDFTIPNTPGAALPNTGGPGTKALYLIGTLLTGLAGAGLLIRRKRRRVA